MVWCASVDLFGPANIMLFCCVIIIIHIVLSSMIYYLNLEILHNVSTYEIAKGCFGRHISVEFQFVKFDLKCLIGRKFEAKTTPKTVILTYSFCITFVLANAISKLYFELT